MDQQILLQGLMNMIGEHKNINWTPTHEHSMQHSIVNVVISLFAFMSMHMHQMLYVCKVHLSRWRVW